MKNYKGFNITAIIALIIFLGLLSCAHGESITPKFFSALCQVETGGATGPILGDGGKALGPLQIHYAYWKDSGVAGKYSDCARYDYSCKVVTAYLNRYGKRFIITRDYQSLARVHNGGPMGYKNPRTNKYWDKVKNFLT
jgi:hypothetical protein